MGARRRRPDGPPNRNRTRTRTRPRSFLLGWRSKLRSAGDEALRARLRSVLSLRDALADISQQHLTSLCLAFAHSGRGKDCKRHGAQRRRHDGPPNRNRTRTRTRPRSFLLGWRSKLRSAGDEAMARRYRSTLRGVMKPRVRRRPCPRRHFHNPFLAYEVGEDFMKFFHDAAAGRNEPFILAIEGSIPD